MPPTAESEIVYGLAFETSGALGSIALGRGPHVLETRPLSGPRKHAAEFLPTVAAVCAAHSVEPADVRRIYVSSGPGSFTGLRIGVTTARMMALATGASIVPVPTLEVIAQNAMDAPNPPERLAVVLDAKRDRVYAAAFVRQGDRYAPVTGPIEVDPAELLTECGTGILPVKSRAGSPCHTGSCAVLGEGVGYHRLAIEASGLPILPESLYSPRAETVYRLGHARAQEGKFTDRRAVVPTYVRPPEAEEKWAQRQKERRS